MNQQIGQLNPNTVSGITYQQSASRSVIDPTSMQAYQKRPGRYRTPGVKRLLRQNVEEEDQQGCCQGCCKYWCWCLLAIFAVFGLLTMSMIGIGYAKQHGLMDKLNNMISKVRGTSRGMNTNQQEEGQAQLKSAVSVDECQTGFFRFQGQCISCPQGSQWSGKNCIRKKKILVRPSSQE